LKGQGETHAAKKKARPQVHKPPTRAKSQRKNDKEKKENVTVMGFFERVGRGEENKQKKKKKKKRLLEYPKRGHKRVPQRDQEKSLTHKRTIKKNEGGIVTKQGENRRNDHERV